MSDGNSRTNERLVRAAREKGWLTGELLSAPELAMDEKRLFIAMLRELPEHLRREHRDELTQDEVASLFNFVFGKAAEAVTMWYSDKEFEIKLVGMFDGQVPVYADENMLESFRQIPLAQEFAEIFLENADEGDPLLRLFDALKITWRLGCHCGMIFLEEAGLIE